MAVKTIGIILNGVTGRMGTNQHLIRSLCAIRDQGGVVSGNDIIKPELILTGRNEEKLAALAARTGVERYTTDLDSVLKDPAYEIFFDASGTLSVKGLWSALSKPGKLFTAKNQQRYLLPKPWSWPIKRKKRA